MREREFYALVKLKQGDPKSAANRAAKRVLVDGISQAEAVRETGATRSTVCDAVKRWADADALVRDAYEVDAGIAGASAPTTTDEPSSLA